MQQRLAGRVLGSATASNSRPEQQTPTIRHLDDGDDEDDAVRVLLHYSAWPCCVLE